MAEFKWPDFKIDQIAIEQAIKELGNEASAQAIVVRADEIKQQLLNNKEKNNE